MQKLNAIRGSDDPKSYKEKVEKLSQKGPELRYPSIVRMRGSGKLCLLNSRMPLIIHWKELHNYSFLYFAACMIGGFNCWVPNEELDFYKEKLAIDMEAFDQKQAIRATEDAQWILDHPGKELPTD